MPALTTIAKKSSKRGGKKSRSASRNARINDMTKREFKVQKMKQGTQRRLNKQNYKLKTAEQRAAVTKTGLRSGAASGTVTAGANSEAVQNDYSQEPASVTNNYNYNYYTIAEQADGGIGGGGSPPGTTGTTDDGTFVPRRGN